MERCAYFDRRSVSTRFSQRLPHAWHGTPTSFSCWWATDKTSVEVGSSFGATSGQVLRKVQLPLAKPSIMLGVNQTIMMALGIIVIAATVGYPGLGLNVYQALQSLNVGAALTAGIGIVILAIVLDRVSYAWSRRDRTRRGSTTIHVFGFSVSRRVGVAVAAVLIVPPS